MTNYVINRSASEMLSTLENHLPTLFKLDYISNLNSFFKTTGPITPLVLNTTEIRVGLGAGKVISLAGSGFALTGYNLTDLVSQFNNIVSSISALNSRASGQISRLSLLDNGIEIGSVQFSNNAWTFTSGQDSIVIRGALPNNFDTINTIFTELFDATGHLKTTFNPSTSILNTIYINSIDTYSNGNHITSLNLDNNQIIATAENYKATITGIFPNTFATFVDIARIGEAGGTPTGYSVNGLKIENVLTGAIIAQISGGTILSSDLANGIGSSGDDSFISYINAGLSVGLGAGNDAAVLAPDMSTLGDTYDYISIDGGTGNDSISFANASAGVRVELWGTGGNIYTTGNQRYFKGSFNNFETIIGTNFDDTFKVSTGINFKNYFDGGVGNNTAVFAGNRSQYNISKASDGSITVIDNRYFSGSNGTNKLTNINTLQFADGNIQASNISSPFSVFGPGFEISSINYHPRTGMASWNGNQFIVSASPTGNYIKGSNNNFSIDLSFQNNVGDFIASNYEVNLGSNLSNLSGTNGKPFVFTTNLDGTIKSGAFWFDKVPGVGYSVKYESFNINLPNATVNHATITNQSSIKDIISGISLTNYGWANSSKNFSIFWETPVNTTNNVKTENIAIFDTNGVALGGGGSFNVSPSSYASYGGTDTDGNYDLFTYSGKTGSLKLYNPGGVVTTNYSAGNFEIGLDSATISTDCYDVANRNSNGSYSNYEVALSGVRNNQGVIDFYQIDTKTLAVTKTQTVTLSGSSGTNRIQDIRLSDNSTIVFGYQDGSSLHLTEIGTDGTIISDYVQTLSSGAIFDRMRGLSNGLFEITYRQPGKTPDSMNYEFQIFDTRSGPISINSTSTTSPTNYAGTVYNDTILISAPNSMVMGSEGNDTLTATSSAINSILSYEYLNEGINANLSTGSVKSYNSQDTLVKTDTISGFKNIIGTFYNDVITGDIGLNRFYVYGGNDTINGNGGGDYVDFYNDRTDYLITQNGNSWIVTDRSSSTYSGITTISNVQFLEFSGSQKNKIDLTAAIINNAMTGTVTITGKAFVGQVLTATNTLSDADGTGIISYQWLRNGIAIDGATKADYIAVKADSDKTLSVKASYIDGWNVLNSTTQNVSTAISYSGTSIESKSNGGSYKRDFNPSDTVIEVVYEYSASNGSGTKISAVVNKTDNSSLVYAYNPTVTVKQTTEQFSNANAGGTKISAVVNNTDNSTLVYAYNPTSSASLTAQTWSGTNSADGSPSGSKISDVVDNTDGTCLIYAYNPTSTVKKTVQKWSGTNVDGSSSGSKISSVVNNNDGTCIVYAYNPTAQVSQSAEIYSATDANNGAPSGSLTTRIMNYVKGGSSVTVFGAGGSEKTTYYSGEDGTGSVIPNMPSINLPNTINLSDNLASAETGLNVPTPTIVGTPAITALHSGEPHIINASLSSIMGVQEISNFQSTTDELVLALNGPNSILQAANIMVDSMAAISLYSSADPTHGIILTGLDQGLTASNLVANHTTFRNGNALIS